MREEASVNGSLALRVPREATARAPVEAEARRRLRLHARVWRLAPPLLVPLLGCAATFWLADTLAGERQIIARSRAAAVADSLEAEIRSALAAELHAFQTLQHLHERDGLSTERLAELGRARFGFTSFELTEQTTQLSDALTLVSAPPAIEITAPSGNGWLVGRVNATSLLGLRLDERAPDYAIRVEHEDAVLYARGEPAPGRDWWVQSRTIELPANASTWRLTLAPTPDLAQLPVASLPAYFRTAGVMISLLLGALLYQGGLARTRAEALERSHTDLESQVRERHRAEDELRDVNASLERRVAERTAELDTAVADLEAFTYSVSHDLRSPLGATVNFAGTLREDYADQLGEEGRDHLERLTASALSALAMMDGLAALSRIGRARPQVGPVDMAALALEVFEEVAAAAGNEDARLELGDLPRAMGDAAMLRTVFTNLFTNALKFAEPSRRLTVAVAAQRAEGEVVYRVKDNGLGFDPRYSQRLFRLFERLRADTGHAGTGVGLAIVARVIRFHDGRVWAEGVPGEGATFFFTLPQGGPA